MKSIAIIPARGGSKRITRKNLNPFLGKPIIAYSIEAAYRTGLFDEVMVSTDNAEIADIAKKYGAKVPFLRSPETSDDYATTASVLLEVIGNYNAIGEYFTYGCCIYPTAPLLKPETIVQGYELIQSQNFNTVFPVLKYSYPIWRSLKKEGSQALMNWPENLTKRSQDLPDAYHDAGQFYWFNIQAFLTKQALFTDNSGVITLDELEAQDIDTLTDWKLAELKYKLLHNLG